MGGLGWWFSDGDKQGPMGGRHTEMSRAERTHTALHMPGLQSAPASLTVHGEKKTDAAKSSALLLTYPGLF